MKTTDPVFYVNAFASGHHQGNAAAVVMVDEFPEPDRMQALAREFGFSETAFLARLFPGRYHIRWFTPQVEVPLCGHATLASAKALFSSSESNSDRLSFQSLSGELAAVRKGELIELDFPAEIAVPCRVEPDLISLLGADLPLAALDAVGSRNLILVYSEPEQVMKIKPDFASLSRLEKFPWLGIAVTASQPDGYICRYFAPWEGIDEDPVTGSAQTYLAPYWSARLNQAVLQGYQASERGGGFEVEVCSGRVLIRGEALLWLRGEIDSGWR